MIYAMPTKNYKHLVRAGTQGHTSLQNITEFCLLYRKVQKCNFLLVFFFYRFWKTSKHLISFRDISLLKHVWTIISPHKIKKAFRKSAIGFQVLQSQIMFNFVWSFISIFLMTFLQYNFFLVNLWIFCWQVLLYLYSPTILNTLILSYC